LGLAEGDTVYVRATRVPPIAEAAGVLSESGADEDQGTLTSLR
ncbi:MAG: sulfate ABC transporter ATP-binding protein, partial [Mycobacterium sp.]